MNLDTLPEKIRLEITKGELEAFAEHLLHKAGLVHSKNPVNPKDSRDIIGIPEAMELTGLARQTLYGLTSRREIPNYKTGRKVYFRRTELETWMLRNRRKTQEEIDALAEQYIRQTKTKAR